MKRLLAVLLVTGMTVSVLAGCNKNNSANDLFATDKSYTYQDSVGTMAANWNPHTYQTTDDAYPADFLRTGLYGFVFNDELHPVEGKDPYTGYKIIPEMAADMPLDVTEKIKAEHPEFGIPESASKGYAYTIDLNRDAVWEDGTPINADTYVWSMQQLLDSKLKNYRAIDYYSQNFSIAGAEEYANSGLTVKKHNSTDGESMTYAFDSLTKGADGQYVTADGAKVYFVLKETLAYLDGDSLAGYAGAGKISADHWAAISAGMDDKGFVPVTDESTAVLRAFITGPDWGNEPASYLGYYIAYDYTYPEVSYDTVGLYKSGEYQITLVLDKSLSGFNLLYNLSGNWIVYQPYYEACLKQEGDLWTSTYNTDVATTMSYGPYKLVAYQADKIMRFERNEKWYGYYDNNHLYVDPTDGRTYSMYMTSAIECERVEESATRKLMFLKGELMGYSLQAEDMDTYRNSEYAYTTPSETIFFLIFNGHKEAIRQREENAGFNTAKYDLQTMTLPSFRKAIAVTYDRELFASTISPARSGGYGLIGSAYLYDPFHGLRYRDTDQAKKTLCDFYSVDVSRFENLDAAVDSITGYDPETAKLLYKQAFDEAITAGYITDTNKDGKSDQTIRIEYCASAVSTFIEKTIDYLNRKVQEVVVGTPFEGRIEIYASAPYGTEWSGKIKSGISDVVLGGWSGSALNPFSLTDLYVNPASAYNGQWFDATGVDLTIPVPVAPDYEEENKKEVTMNLKQWSDALNGATVSVNGVAYNFGEDQADLNTRLDILAAFETRILQTYDYIPMLQDGGMSLLSQQVYYVVEEYNPVMGRGGIAYLKYNYSDAEWTEFVASQGGELRY